MEWIEEGLTGVRIYEKLKEKGIRNGYSTVKDYLAQIKRREKVFVRIHTLLGEEAQVDFCYVGLTYYQRRMRKTWVFNMRLSYSRLDYYYEPPPLYWTPS